MLKAVIRLFAEKVLTSKKEWVAKQNTLAVPSVVEVSAPTDGLNLSYTSPFDGVIVVKHVGNRGAADNYELDIFHSTLRVQSFYAGNAWGSVFMPVAKGQNVSVRCSLADSLMRIYWIPYTGAE